MFYRSCLLHKYVLCWWLELCLGLRAHKISCLFSGLYNIYRYRFWLVIWHIDLEFAVFFFLLLRCIYRTYSANASERSTGMHFCWIYHICHFCFLLKWHILSHGFRLGGDVESFSVFFFRTFCFLKSFCFDLLDML